MNWHRHPELLDRLAAEYALGTMHGGARRRFEAVMQQHLFVAQAAARWDAQLAPLGAKLPPMVPSAGVWSAIERRALLGGSAAAPPAAPRAAAVAVSWWQRMFAPLPAGALAFGLMLGVATPTVFQLLQADQLNEQLPESYVGVLATAQGRQGLIVSSLRRGTTVDLKVIQPVPVPAASGLFLWTIDAEGAVRPVGPLPALSGGFISMKLSRPAEEVFFHAVELAVSVEAAGSTPAVPRLPYAYRGLCGKLWRVTPLR